MLNFKQHMAKAIVLSTLMICATILECFGKPAGGLWFIAVLWLLLADWSHKCCCKSKSDEDFRS